MKRLLLILLGLSLTAFGAVTPNMDLNKPVIGGTNYAQLIDTIFNQIDAHDHSPGKGVQIGSAGIQPGAIQTTNIQAQAITSSLIAPNAITQTSITAGAVGSSQIANGSVGQIKLAGPSPIVLSSSMAAAITTNIYQDIAGSTTGVLTSTGRAILVQLQATAETTAGNIGTLTCTSNDNLGGFLGSACQWGFFVSVNGAPFQIFAEVVTASSQASGSLSGITSLTSISPGYAQLLTSVTAGATYSFKVETLVTPATGNINTSSNIFHETLSAVEL